MLPLAAGLLIFRGVYLNSVPASVLPADAAAALFDTFVRFIKEGRKEADCARPAGPLVPPPDRRRWAGQSCNDCRLAGAGRAWLRLLPQPRG
jgi:hypothetical protein